MKHHLSLENELLINTRELANIIIYCHAVWILKQRAQTQIGKLFISLQKRMAYYLLW